MERAVVVSYRHDQGETRRFGFAALIDQDGKKLPGRDIHFHFNDSRVPTIVDNRVVFHHNTHPDRAPISGDIIVFDRSVMRDKGKSGFWAFESDWLAAEGEV
jgi:hypothetical protein